MGELITWDGVKISSLSLVSLSKMFTSLLLDDFALLSCHSLVGQRDHFSQSLPLVLREVRGELSVPLGVAGLDRSQNILEDAILVHWTILVVQGSGVGLETSARARS